MKFWASLGETVQLGHAAGCTFVYTLATFPATAVMTHGKHAALLYIKTQNRFRQLVYTA